jgi:hypothetical protein
MRAFDIDYKKLESIKRIFMDADEELTGLISRETLVRAM